MAGHERTPVRDRSAHGSLLQFHPGWKWRTLTMSDAPYGDYTPAAALGCMGRKVM